MCEQYINSFHIEKLGHKIQEIRERALHNITSKLNNGVLFDNDLARNKELLDKLLKWFLFEPCVKEDLVFALLKRILKSESGQTLIHHLGKDSLISDLEQIHLYLEPKYLCHLEELLEIVNNSEPQNIVPPLHCEIPLSYRSGESESEFSQYVDTTATVVEGTVHKQSSAEQQTGAQKYSKSTNPTTFEDTSTYRIRDNDIVPDLTNFPNYYFEWQPLIEADRHVLLSVENSLVNPPQPASLLHSCDFFCHVLLHDFPAEIFLQRPKIVLEFFCLLNCGSSRIANAALHCLCDLTTELQIRINHSNDASLRNVKLKHIADLSFPATPVSSTNKGSGNDDIFSEIRDKFEKNEDIVALQRSQISTLKYCQFCINAVFTYLCAKNDTCKETKTKTNQVAINFCLVLLEKILGLMTLCLEKQIWDTLQTDRSVNLFKLISDIFISYGMALEHFRVESISSENNLKYRGIYLYLLHNCANVLQKLVPFSKSVSALPRNLKTALANSLLDVTFCRLYPAVHHLILNYVQNFSVDEDKEHLRKYEEVKRICQGMSSAVKFLNQHKNLTAIENFQLASEALPSLEFHKDFDFLKIYVDLCAQKYSQISDDSNKVALVEEITLSLLNHEMSDIRQEMYRLCQTLVISYIGPKLNDNTGIVGSQVEFLLSSRIFVEIACYGLDSDSYEIQKYAEDILIYILKCKCLVSERIWNRTIQALIPSLPIIVCQLSKSSLLSKTITSLVDPDIAKQCTLPTISMLKSNILFLFLDDPYLREEAFSRICWLLSSQENARELLPGFNTLYDTSLAGVCKCKKVLDINKIRRTEHFYQPSSLNQVLEVIGSCNVEPVIKRSALNQISVMLEDPLLHQIFLDANGLNVVIDVMISALTEKEYRDYPDSVIPVISVFKNLCLHHGSVREELSTNVDVFYFILRGLFLFFTEERLKQDATIVLFLLIFKDYIWGSPSRANFSLPKVVVNKTNLPFICNSHWAISEYRKTTLKDKIAADRWCLSSIQIQWNAEIFGGFDQIVKWDEIVYEDHSSVYNFVDLLKLTKYDLKCIKNSSLDYCFAHSLKGIQNGTSHCAVLESIDHLTMYLYLHKLSSEFDDSIAENILDLPWESTFSRFLKVLPSCDDDAVLLKRVLHFLCILVTYYTASEADCWITSFLKDSSHCLLDLLTVDDTTEDDIKIIAQELLKLITVCVRQEQHYLDYYPPYHGEERKTWYRVIKIIADNLKNSGKQHFYNLAYLDSLLSCLVHLTATLGWSESKPGSVLKDPVSQMILHLCELVRAFHSGKGPSASVSVMGLSITRNVLLVLNHILAEVQNYKIKGWEKCFFEDIEIESPMCSFIALWASRDIILRAASLQFFAGLTSSPRAAIEILHEVKSENSSIWDISLRVLVDHTEASAVRENAAELLSNLTSHSTPLGVDKSNGVNYALKKSSTMTLFNIIDQFDFYASLEIILGELYILNVPYRRFRHSGKKILDCNSNSEHSWSSSSEMSMNNLAVSTPGLVKTVGNFLYNLLWLDPETVSQKMQDQGLVKLLFRAMCNPCMSITNTRELSLYCDIVDMNSTISSVLLRLASYNTTCLGTILHTKDCLNSLISLLNPKVYHMNLPQLIYLRNKLWTSIFNLLSTLIEFSGESEDVLSDRSIEAVNIFSGTLSELGHIPFIETLCESVSNLGSHDLQNAALNFLTSLLRVEAHRYFTASDNVPSNTIQSLLDTTRMTRSVILLDNNTSKKSITTTKKSLETQKLNVLEEIYFGKVFVKPDETFNDDIEVSIIENTGDGLLSGAEICKILLFLYDLSNLKETSLYYKKKGLVTKALSSLLCISKEAKRYALEKKLVHCIIKQFRDHHIRLSLESVECIRRVSEKKRLCPLLKEIDDLVCLMTNFMVDDENVKVEAAAMNLADIIHKLWVWFQVQSGTAMLANVLKMVCTYTTGCDLACQTLPLTSPVAGGGPRKSPGIVTLLHAFIALINKQMDQISKTHDLRILEISFDILHNSCQSLECRALISKSSIFQSLSRLHPAITKRQKPWEIIELLWLDFLQTFTSYPEGQASVAKITDVFELILTLANSSKIKNKLMAMLVLRNISFHQSNKARLLSSADFLNVLLTKLSTGSDEEKNIVVVIMWALAANSQKAKIILKGVHLDDKLQNILKHYHLVKSKDGFLKTEDVERISYVLGILRDNNDKIR